MENAYNLLFFLHLNKNILYVWIQFFIQVLQNDFQIKQFDTLFGVNWNGNGIYLSKFSVSTPRYAL